MHPRLCALLLLGCTTALSGEPATPPASAPAAATPAPDGGPMPRVPVKADAGRKFYREVDEKEVRELTSIPAKPAACPSCGGVVRLPQREIRARDIDADLCPHPTGKIRFFSHLALCPRCGFSAFHADYGKALTPETKDWIRKTLTPNLLGVQRQILGPFAKVSADGRKILVPEGGEIPLDSFFEAQEQLPDPVRCENALLFYTKAGADPLKLARLAWTCAWAYRREICGPVDGPYLMESLRRIFEAIDKGQGQYLEDVSARVNLLADLCERKSGDAYAYTFQERQLLRILLAGQYDRLGLRTWAADCLRRVAQTAAKPVGPGTEDPWLKETPTWTQGENKTPVERPAAERQAEAQARRRAVGAAATVRLAQLDKEELYLAQAADLLRQALGAGLIPPARAPQYVYLIGEFERRRGRFESAKPWLELAASIAGPDAQAEAFAAGQLESMADYRKRIGPAGAPEADPNAPADRALLEKISPALRAATRPAPKVEEGLRSGGPAATPPALPRNEVRLE